MDKQISQELDFFTNELFKLTMFQSGKGLHSIPHREECIKILYILRGSLVVEINDNSSVVNTGDLFLIFPDEPHTITTTEKDNIAFWEVTYDIKLLYLDSQSAVDNKFLFSFNISGQLGQRLFSRNLLTEQGITSILENIIEEYENPSICSDVAIRLYISQLSLWFLRCWKTNDDSRDLTSINDMYSMNLLQKIFTFVDQEYMNKIKMETIANECCMSYHSFSKFFISHTGKTFPSYVNEVRLTKTKILLTTSSMNITEIAMEVGYTSASHFIQRFKESNKMTPLQFRNEFKK